MKVFCGLTEVHFGASASLKLKNCVGCMVINLIFIPVFYDNLYKNVIICEDACHIFIVTIKLIEK
jgi:hypothetical protein